MRIFRSKSDSVGVVPDEESVTATDQVQFSGENHNHSTSKKTLRGAIAALAVYAIGFGAGTIIEDKNDIVNFETTELGDEVRKNVNEATGKCDEQESKTIREKYALRVNDDSTKQDELYESRQVAEAEAIPAHEKLVEACLARVFGDTVNITAIEVPTFDISTLPIEDNQ